MAGSPGPCGSCKLLRRRCAEDCIFAPFFPADDLGRFALVHRVFGASNVGKMLQGIPHHQRADAVASLVYEASARTRDPVYGCLGAISYLQNQVSHLQVQLAVAQAELLCVQMQKEEACTQTVDVGAGQGEPFDLFDHGYSSLFSRPGGSVESSVDVLM